MSVDRSCAVRLAARLDAPLSPGLWLVKWLLVIPHLVVLAVLWLVFLPATVVAGIAILATGRYPRPIFDFTTGVLRWSWRVAYYSYSGLGTDRYPPFTLGPVPDYPATLDIRYPERLSRGAVLVKWWLLAVPHYVVIAAFTGASYTVYRASVDQGATNGALSVWVPGLLTVLVVIAGVVLLFTGRYPEGIFVFVMGMNRWVFRVAAYAALMTDDYPPFRLDLGGDEPMAIDGSAAPVPGEAA